MSTRSFFSVAFSVATLAIGAAAFGAGCAAPEDSEDESGETGDALSESECNKIVTRAVGESRTECTEKQTLADQKKVARNRLEQNVVSAVNAFGTVLSNYKGANLAEVDETLRECNALTCEGQLRRGEVQAECGVELAFLKAACFTRNVDELRAAALSLDFSKELDALNAALDDMASDWPSLAVQEASLRVQHAACSTYVGSSVQKKKLYGTCRASCNEKKPTEVGGVLTGWGASCTPPGYEDVKDDLGQEVECGTFQRPFLSAGTICECLPTDACTQFSTLGASSERGRECGDGKEKKLVWDTKTNAAHLDCR
jgi:hypothetical protein